MFSKEQIENWVELAQKNCRRSTWQEPYKVGWLNGLTYLLVLMDDAVRSEQTKTKKKKRMTYAGNAHNKGVSARDLLLVCLYASPKYTSSIELMGHKFAHHIPIPFSRNTAGPAISGAVKDGLVARLADAKITLTPAGERAARKIADNIKKGEA